MKLPFARSFETSLSTAREKRDIAEAKILALLRDREAALIASDDVAKVDAIDHAIDAERRTAGILTDRIAALISEARAEQRAQRQRERVDAIAASRLQIEQRNSIAGRLAAALAQVRTAAIELIAADAALFSGHRHLDFLSISAMPELCRRDRRASDFEPRVIVGPVRSIAEGAADGLLEEIRNKGQRLIEILESEPIFEPDDEVDEVDNTEVAA
jgi:hypothetical protein